MKLLDGKNAVVTGGSRGIGAAICAELAAQGAYVVIGFARSPEAAEKLLAEIKAAGGEGEVRQLDVTDGAALDVIAEEMFDRRGSLDIWVNNAGIGHDELLLSMDEADWLKVIDANLNGTMRGVRAAAKWMMLKKSGSIINISSIAARYPNRGQSNYAASKGGIDAFTKAMAVELAGKRVRVNAIAPGFIETDMTHEILETAGKELVGNIPLKRVGRPAEIGRVAVFLASDWSSYMTGEIVTVDGGLSLKV